MISFKDILSEKKGKASFENVVVCQKASLDHLVGAFTLMLCSEFTVLRSPLHAEYEVEVAYTPLHHVYVRVETTHIRLVSVPRVPLTGWFQQRTPTHQLSERKTMTLAELRGHGRPITPGSHLFTLHGEVEVDGFETGAWIIQQHGLFEAVGWLLAKVGVPEADLDACRDDIMTMFDYDE